MNVVVVDSAHLAGEADFPMLALDKFGWQQYPELTGEEVAERCWRADIIISVDTPIDKRVIDKAFKLKLIVAAANAVGHIDREAAAARGITVCHVPGADPAQAAAAEAICTQVVETINAYLNDAPIHCVD
jgi:lactate dehydrogenase-like 2-hydroxyacid dehydrogenase